MNKAYSSLILFSLLCANSFVHGLDIIHDPVIYGEDDRIEVTLHPNLTTQTLAAGVAGQVWNRQLIEKENSSEFTFVKESLSSVYNICPTEKFSEQAILPRCTGFLVAKDILVTAGHCLQSSSQSNLPSDVCRLTSWVFNYHSGSETFQKEEIYQCDKVLAFNENLDYAVIKLEKSVSEKQVLSLDYSSPKDNEEVFSIGHGLFLPKKVYEGGRLFTGTGLVENDYSTQSEYIVKGGLTPIGESSHQGNYVEEDETLNIQSYIANLDTFMGNSGSPVFSKETNKVIGILVGGAEDFTYDERNSCYLYNKKTNDREVAEEEILPITVLKDILGAL